MVTFSLMLAWSHRKLSHFVTCIKEQIDLPLGVAISVLMWSIPQPVHPGQIMAVTEAVGANTSQLLNWTYYSASAQNGCVAERSGSKPYILSRTTWKWRKIRDQNLCVNSTKARRRWWVKWGILCFAIPPIPVLCFAIPPIPVLCFAIPPIPVLCFAIPPIPVLCFAIPPIPVLCFAIPPIPVLCFAIPPIPVLCFVWIVTFIAFSMWIITWLVNMATTSVFLHLSAFFTSVLEAANYLWNQCWVCACTHPPTRTHTCTQLSKVLSWIDAWSMLEYNSFSCFTCCQE